MSCSTPRLASVVAKMWRFAAEPYFLSSSSRNTRKLSAGSSVVPDLLMTFTSKSSSPSWPMMSFI